MAYNKSLKFVCIAFAAATAQPSFSNTLYEQSFDINTTTTAQTLSTYGLVSTSISAVVDDGKLRLSTPGILYIGAFSGDIVVTFETTIAGRAGSVNVGLLVGDNNYIFHPGYSGGAFRIEGPDGHDNVNMGFTPSTSLNQFKMSVNAQTGQTQIQITSGINTYQESFIDSNYLPGTTIFGLSTGGSGTGVFDNLVVSSVPEPTSALLAVVGLLVVGARVQRHGKHP